MFTNPWCDKDIGTVISKKYVGLHTLGCQSVIYTIEYTYNVQVWLQSLSYHQTWLHLKEIDSYSNLIRDMVSIQT